MIKNQNSGKLIVVIKSLKTLNHNKFVSNLVFTTSDTNRLIYYPIPCGLFHLNAIDMQHLNNLRFEMQIDSANWVTSGTASNLTLNNVYLAFGSRHLPDFDRNMSLKEFSSNPHIYQFLDFERIQINNKALTASATQTFDLDDFNHKSAFLLVHILGASGSPTDANLINWYDVGDLGRFDVQNHTGQSLLGEGNALYEAQIYEKFVRMVEKLPLRGWYIIPFCEQYQRSLGRFA